jgi:voltage-gated potassium channel
MTESAASERTSNLRNVPVFSELSDDALAHIVDVATEFEAEPGHILVQPNQPGTGLFVIEEGTVVVELPGKTSELGPGEFFGELALLHEDTGHTARVHVGTHLKALAIRRDDFEELLESQPRLAINMLKTVAGRLIKRG